MTCRATLLYIWSAVCLSVYVCSTILYCVGHITTDTAFITATVHCPPTECSCGHCGFTHNDIHSKQPLLKCGCCTRTNTLTCTHNFNLSTVCPIRESLENEAHWRGLADSFSVLAREIPRTNTHLPAETGGFPQTVLQEHTDAWRKWFESLMGGTPF